MDGSPTISPKVVREAESEALSRTIRGIEDDALEQQARLALDPLPKGHRGHQWLRRGARSHSARSAAGAGSAAR